LEHPAQSLISGRAARLAAPNLEERFTAKARGGRKLVICFWLLGRDAKIEH
jgi:hypothetical protein